MKLYTEEQLHNTVMAVANYLDDINLTRAQENIEKHLKALKPIDLPSDEEMREAIQDKANKYSEGYRCPATNENEYCRHDIISAFNRGAKAMYNLINANKQQDEQ